MGNQEPALQLRSKQPLHLPSLPVSNYISIPCCSLIPFPFFRNLLLPVSLGDVPTVRPWQWKKCRSSAPGSSSSSKHCGYVSWMVNAGTRCFERGPAGRPRHRWARHPGAMPTLRREALGGAGYSGGDLPCCPTVTSITCQTSWTPGHPGHLQMGQNVRRFSCSPGSFSALCGCVCWFIRQQGFAHPENYLTFPGHAVSQQYRGILNNESSGPHHCFLFSKSTSL